jgi:hypothetical protein
MYSEHDVEKLPLSLQGAALNAMAAGLYMQNVEVTYLATGIVQDSLIVGIEYYDREEYSHWFLWEKATTGWTGFSSIECHIPALPEDGENYPPNSMSVPNTIGKTITKRSDE